MPCLPRQSLPFGRGARAGNCLGLISPQLELLKVDVDSVVHSTGCRSDPTRNVPTKCTLPWECSGSVQVDSRRPFPCIRPLHTWSPVPLSPVVTRFSIVQCPWDCGSSAP